MTKEVEFFFDVGSPAAYLAWTQMAKLCEASSARLAYKPILLGGVFHATGNQSPMSVPAKAAYMIDDLKRFAKRYGVSFEHNPHFPINTLTLMRIATGLQVRDETKLVPCMDAVYKAIWVDGQNMNDPATVAGVLQAARFDPQALLALAGEAQVKERLKAVTQDAVARGVFGAPAFIVDGRLYWGQDRLDFVKQALEEKA